MKKSRFTDSQIMAVFSHYQCRLLKTGGLPMQWFNIALLSLAAVRDSKYCKSSLARACFVLN
jgi:hypothetical protein